MEHEVHIRRADANDALLLSELSKTTFIQSHGHSAAPADIESYVHTTYSIERYTEELKQPDNMYHLVTLGTAVVGYSKLVLNQQVPGGGPQQAARLDRLYLLETCHGKNIGHYLFQQNLALARMHKQQGIWLYVWKENLRALQFYTRAGMHIIGEYSFKLTPNHANPNHIMYMALLPSAQ